MAQYRHLVHLPPHYSQKKQTGSFSGPPGIPPPFQSLEPPESSQHVCAGRREASRSVGLQTRGVLPCSAVGSASVWLTAVTPTRRTVPGTRHTGLLSRGKWHFKGSSPDKGKADTHLHVCRPPHTHTTPAANICETLSHHPRKQPCDVGAIISSSYRGGKWDSGVVNPGELHRSVLWPLAWCGRPTQRRAQGAGDTSDPRDLLSKL